MRIVAIVQARCDSTRLPGKVLLPLNGKPMLQHIIDRLSAVPEIEDVAVATTDRLIDEPIWHGPYRAIMNRCDPSDVLTRYYETALVTRADLIVRVTGDCPMVDPALVSRVIKKKLAYRAKPHVNAAVWPWQKRLWPTRHEQAKRKIISGRVYPDFSGFNPYPDGYDVECFTLHQLRCAWATTVDPDKRQHVTSYVYDTPDFGPWDAAVWSEHYWPDVKLSIDTDEDYHRVARIYGVLGDTFSADDVRGYLEGINA